MNKIITIVLILIVVGAAAYFLFLRKKKPKVAGKNKVGIIYYANPKTIDGTEIRLSQKSDIKKGDTIQIINGGVYSGSHKVVKVYIKVGEGTPLWIFIDKPFEDIGEIEAGTQVDRKTKGMILY